GKGASGGELSRVALALARELARSDGVPILILDEVDQNVGGRLGRALGLTLHEIARSRQVITVTHLPSVAAAPDRHFLVTKSRPGSRTTVAAIEKEERVREIAAMIGGDPVSAAALAEATDLLARGKTTVPRADRRGAVRRAARAGRRVSEAGRA